MSTPSLPELVGEMRRLSRLIDQGVQALVDKSQEYAVAEDRYRAAKATAYLGITEGTVDYKKAKVDSLCGKERYARLLAEGMRQAAIEALRSRRQQLSAIQSIAKAYSAEADLVSFGPPPDTP